MKTGANKMKKSRSIIIYLISLLIYSLIIVLLNGLESTKAQTVISVGANYQPCNGNGMGIRANINFEKDFFHIVPNPNNGIFKMQISSIAFCNSGQFTLEIINLLGRQVFLQHLFIREENKSSIVYMNQSGLSSGVYLIKLILPSGGFNCQKLIIE